MGSSALDYLSIISILGDYNVDFCSRLPTTFVSKLC